MKTLVLVLTLVGAACCAIIAVTCWYAGEDWLGWSVAFIYAIDSAVVPKWHEEREAA